MNFLLLLISFLVFLVTIEYNEAKKNDAPLRQKCESFVLPSDDSPQLIYYELLGPNYTTHYAWSFKDTPSLYMALTGHTDKCNTVDSINGSINWTTFPEYGSATLPGLNSSYSFMIVFNRLIEFKDEDDKAQKAFHPEDLDNGNIYRNYSLSDLDWTFHDGKASGSDSLGLKWDVRINVPVEQGRLSYFPKTLYTENSTTFDFAFRNFNYSSISTCDSGKCGRLALDLILVHGRNLLNGDISVHFSRDDEYTPSIFLTYNYLFGDVGTILGRYLQWKPISYLSDKRKSTKSEQINTVPGPSGDNVTIPLSLASALYDESNSGNVTHLYLVMGTEGDDNNYNPDYVSWTALLGYGDVPYDSISMVVIITIAVGLGVPLILIVLGAVYVVIKKKPWEKFTQKGKGYAPVINENDDK